MKLLLAYLIAVTIVHALGTIAWARRLHRSGWPLSPAIFIALLWPLIWPVLWSNTRKSNDA